MVRKLNVKRIGYKTPNLKKVLAGIKRHKLEEYLVVAGSTASDYMGYARLVQIHPVDSIARLKYSPMYTLGLPALLYDISVDNSLAPRIQNFLDCMGNTCYIEKLARPDDYSVKTLRGLMVEDELQCIKTMLRFGKYEIVVPYIVPILAKLKEKKDGRLYKLRYMITDEMSSNYDFYFKFVDDYLNNYKYVWVD